MTYDQELAEDPMTYPDAIIIYHLKDAITGKSIVSVQIDTKRQLQLEYVINNED